jgi:pimeloyl-ACP methyl ester carboxylesterase
MAAAERWVDARHDLISLPGVGHLPHEEAPAAVSTAIIDWLKAL